MSKKYTKEVLLVLFITLFVPAVTEAKGIMDFVDRLYSIITSTLIPLAFGLCLLYFFWGVAKYIRGASNPKEAQDGKNVMIWGIVGLFVAVSIWGIIVLIRSELGIPNIENVQKN